MAYAIYLKVSTDRGKRGMLVFWLRDFFEVRGEEREWWRAGMKAGMMKGQKCSHEMERKRH